MNPDNGVEGSMTTCKICGNAVNNRLYTTREMMFGFRETFEYVECNACGCLHIKEVPQNLSRYYPDNYWQFEETRMNYSMEQGLSKWMRHQRARYWLYYGRNPIGRLFAMRHVQPVYYGWLRRGKVRFDDAILDVGCGIGDRLLELSKDGFRNLTGIDPFISADIHHQNGVKIFKKNIHEIDGAFDFIMLHHSFEHMPDPESALRELNRLLKKGRFVLIRIPVASSFAWRDYGVHWVQLDAPRHLFLHTLKSMQILAHRVDFRIADVVFDSGSFQFWGSEQYLQDISLYDSRSYAVNPKASIFSAHQIEAFQKRAWELNNNKEGDQACFYLYKA